MADTRVLYIEEIPILTKEKLNSKETFESVRKLVIDLSEGNDTSVALTLSKKLEQLVGNTIEQSTLEPGLYQNYNKVIILLKYIAMSEISNMEMEELFKNNLSLILSSKNIDILEKIKYTLLVYGDPQTGLHLLNIINKGLNNNEEKFGDEKIKDSEGKIVNNTIKNWLVEYNRFTSKKKGRGAVERGNFIANNKNAKKLTEEQKQFLSKLFLLYDFIRLPYGKKDYNIERGEMGFQESHDQRPDINEMAGAEEETIAPIETNVKKVEKQPTIAEEIQTAYQGDSLFQQQIEKEEKSISQKVGNDNQKLRDEFFRAVQLRNKARTIACFIQLVKFIDIEKFLAEDQRLKKFLAVTWNQKHGKVFADEFEKDPAQAKYIKAFVRYVLEDRLEMAESESARVAAKLANLFKKQGQEKYAKIAYFDMKDKKFKFFGDAEH